MSMSICHKVNKRREKASQHTHLSKGCTGSVLWYENLAQLFFSELFFVAIVVLDQVQLVISDSIDFAMKPAKLVEKLAVDCDARRESVFSERLDSTTRVVQLRD